MPLLRPEADDPLPSFLRPPLRIRARMAARRLSWRVASWAHWAPRLTERGVWWIGFILACAGFWWMTASALVAFLSGGAS